jgi:hypothetical protein
MVGEKKGGPSVAMSCADGKRQGATFCQIYKTVASQTGAGTGSRHAPARNGNSPRSHKVTKENGPLVCVLVPLCLGGKKWPSCFDRIGSPVKILPRAGHAGYSAGRRRGNAELNSIQSMRRIALTKHGTSSLMSSLRNVTISVRGRKLETKPETFRAPSRLCMVHSSSSSACGCLWQASAHEPPSWPARTFRRWGNHLQT